MPEMRRDLRPEKGADAGASFSFLEDAEMPALRETQYDGTGEKAKISGRLKRRNRL